MTKTTPQNVFLNWLQAETVHSQCSYENHVSDGLINSLQKSSRASTQKRREPALNLSVRISLSADDNADV